MPDIHFGKVRQINIWILGRTIFRMSSITIRLRGKHPFYSSNLFFPFSNFETLVLSIFFCFWLIHLHTYYLYENIESDAVFIFVQTHFCWWYFSIRKRSKDISICILNPLRYLYRAIHSIIHTNCISHIFLPWENLKIEL